MLVSMGVQSGIDFSRVFGGSEKLIGVLVNLHRIICHISDFRIFVFKGLFGYRLLLKVEN